MAVVFGKGLWWDENLFTAIFILMWVTVIRQSWHDRWCGDQSLEEVFPLLFECSRDCDAYIDSLYTRNSEHGGWVGGWGEMRLAY